MTTDTSQIGPESSKTSRSDKPRRGRIPLVGTVCVGLGLMLILACVGAVALIGCGTDLFPPSDGTTETADIGIPGANDDPFLTPNGLTVGRVRIQSPDGVFVLSDAGVPKDLADRRPAFLAWWNDFATRKMFVFGRLIETQGDVGHAVLNLERDLDIDLDALIDKNAALNQSVVDSAAQSEDATDWQPTTYGTAMEIMGFPAPQPTGDPAMDILLFDGGGDELLPCPEGSPDAVFCWDTFDGSESCLCQRILCPCPGSCCPVVKPPCTSSNCDDGLFCNGTEICTGFRVCTPDDPPCEPGYCNEAEDRCNECISSADCDDGQWCNGPESCESGSCVPGSDPCPGQQCNEALDRCEECSSSADCGDGQFCNGSESCDSGSCVPGTDPCPGQQCNEALDRCEECSSSPDCGDGQFCNGSESCESGSCVPGSDPCPGQQCNEALDRCDECSSSPDCDDGQFCNGPEACESGNCVPGSDPCPGQQCDEALDRCVECSGNADCDDGLFCNGTESCVDVACQSGNPPCPVALCNEETDTCTCNSSNDCNDGDPCTDDTCEGGVCVVVPKDCDDRVFCNGAEECVVGACVAGAPPCEAPRCQEDTDTCSCTTSADCDDGLFCNGSEICEFGDCAEGSDPCPALLCDENLGSCVECLGIGPCVGGPPCTDPNFCVGGVCGGGARMAIDCEGIESCDELGIPNSGETEILGALQSTMYLCLPPPGSSALNEKSISVTHYIVTHDTPRSRDLHGRLKLSRALGDATVVALRYGGNPYTLGAPIPVIETAHGGCRLHDWHFGEETFTLIPRSLGEVTLKASVDPAAECCEGDGVPSVEAEITVKVISLDLDIDSDNNNGTGLPDRSLGEDVLERTFPGKLIPVNDDGDNSNDLVRMVVELAGNAPGGNWRLQYDASKVQVYEDNRITMVPSGEAFTLPLTPNPKNFWVEGVAVTLEAPTTIAVVVDMDDDGIIDCSDSVVATVLKLEFKTFPATTSGPDTPHDLNVATSVNEEAFYNPYKKCVSHIWSNEPLDMARYLDGYDDPEMRQALHVALKWRVNGGAWQENYQLDLETEPGEDEIERFNIEVAWQGKTEPRDHLIVTVVPPVTQADFNQWYTVESNDMAWLTELPATYSFIILIGGDPQDPEPDDCSPQLWRAPTTTHVFYHPGAVFEMRSEPTPGGHGHQVTYDENGNLIRIGLGAGSADRAAPCLPSWPFGCDPHWQADARPFIWAAQMDGNAVEAVSLGTDLSAPIMHFGYYLQQYLEARPIVPNGKPELVHGSCPQE